MDATNLPISKFDTARRQLETAVRLYFFHGDPVSVHTLVSAAAQVLLDIMRRRSTEAKMIRGALLRYVRPEHQSEVKKKLAEAENFFKHADRDPEEALQFKVAQTEIFLLDAIEAYTQLTSEQVPLFMVYRMWFIMEVGKELVMPGKLETARKAGQQTFATSSQEAFFADALPVAMSMGVQL